MRRWWRFVDKFLEHRHRFNAALEWATYCFGEYAYWDKEKERNPLRGPQKKKGEYRLDWERHLVWEKDIGGKDCLVQGASRQGVRPFSLIAIEQIFFGEGDNSTAAAIVEAVVKSRDYERWQALISEAARKVRAREMCSEAVRDFIANVLLGKLSAPKKKPGQKTRDESRNFIIESVIQDLCENFELKPTRNETGSGQPNVKGGSACDVVGIVLKEYGLSRGYKTYEAIWNNRTGGDRVKLIKGKVPKECQPSPKK